MKRQYLFLLLFLFLAVSCVRDESDPVIDDGEKGFAFQLPDEYEPGWVRIKFKSLSDDIEPTRSGPVVTGIPELDEVAARLGATQVGRLFAEGGKYSERRRAAGLHLWYDFYVGEDQPLTRAMSDFSQLDFIEIVEAIPVYRQSSSDNVSLIDYTLNMLPGIEKTAVSTRAIPTTNFNDPLLGRQWHYQNDGTSSTQAKVGADINLFAAWQITTGHPGVTVAVMDGGVDYSHPDLARNMWINTAEMNGTSGVDDDGNGYKDDIYGYRWGSSSLGPGGGDIKPMDHGSHCAGTIAAVNNNGVGVGGVAGGNGSANSGVRIMSCQTYVPDPDYPDDPYGNSRSTSQTPDAFAYAADNGAVIVNCSFSYSGTTLSAAYKAGIDYFVDNAGDYPGSPLKGGLVVCAAGNDGQEITKYPASYERCISVAYMTSDFVKSSSSNYGSWIDITAPGGATSSSYAPNKVGGVFSTIPMASANYDVQVGYAYKSGTSMAAPHMAGVAALMVSAMVEKGVTDYTLEELRKALLLGTRDINQYNPVYRGKLGVGYSDARLALDFALGNDVDIPGVASISTISSTNFINVIWDVPGGLQGNKPESFIVLYGTSALENADYDNPAAGIDKVVVVNEKEVGLGQSVKLEDLMASTQYNIGIVTEYNDGLRSAPLLATASTASADAAEISFYLTPTQVRDYLYIYCLQDPGSQIDIKIFNGIGNKVLDKKATITTTAPVTLDLSKLSTGVYTVAISYKNGSEFRSNIAKL